MSGADPSPESPAALRQAAALVVGAMAGVAVIDNFVPAIAAEAGLWQFHLTRAALALPVLVLVCRAMGWRLAPVRPARVAARSLFAALAMVVYFGSLAVLPIGVVAAGLFTAPVFVLLISAAALGERIGPRQVLAVALGFAGILLILEPWGEGLSLLALVPVLSGAFYAVSAIGTRHWCRGEAAVTLLGGFFLFLGLFGAAGAVAVTFLLPESLRAAAPASAAFVLRPWEPMPGAAFWVWTTVQAAASLVGVGMVTRAYQIAAASRVAVFEYSFLVFAPVWALILFGQALSLPVVLGMGAIMAAGLILSVAPRAAARGAA